MTGDQNTAMSDVTGMDDGRKPNIAEFSPPAGGLTPRQVAILLIIGLIVIILLGIALQPALRDAVALPLAYGAWLVGLVFRSVPGILWWAWLLIVMVVIISKSLRGRRELPDLLRAEPVRQDGPVTLWANRIYLSRNSEYFRWRLAHELARLALSLRAYREGLSTTRVGRQRAIELDGPPELTAYLTMGLGTAPDEPQRWPASLTDVAGWLRDVWRARRLATPRRSPLALPPEQVIAFLEKELE